MPCWNRTNNIQEHGLVSNRKFGLPLKRQMLAKSASEALSRNWSKVRTRTNNGKRSSNKPSFEGGGDLLVCKNDVWTMVIVYSEGTVTNEIISWRVARA